MEKKLTRKQKQYRGQFAADEHPLVVTPIHQRRKVTEPLKPQTEAQAFYLDAMTTHELIFGAGPAGTGKTYVAAAYAAQELLAKRTSRVIITRPNIEVGQPMGFLPGELEEKYAPFLAPFREVMIERMGVSHYEYAIKAGQICPEPLGYMRGKTFDDAIVILDEAQNCTPAEMKMFLTRIGKNCTVIVNGDIQQCDLSGPSGLSDAIKRVNKIDGVAIVEFSEGDIVRSGMVREILKAYRRRV